MEWFRSSKQRKPVPVNGEVSAPELKPAAPAPVATPKARFDNAVLSEVLDAPRMVRPAATAKVGFTIHSSRNGERGQTQLTSPTLTVAKARMLFKSGWLVHITDATGRHFAPSQFDDILKFD